MGKLVALGEWLHVSHDLFAVFRARIIEDDPTVQPGDVAVEVRWVEPEEVERLMPWYPSGVRALLEGSETVYYVAREPSGGS